jgi:hypothetical protein
MIRQVNWYGGWGLILTAFAVGAGLGLFFHREDFWGGYASWRRRLSRLGHIAMVALGFVNVTYSLSPAPSPVAGAVLFAGALAMPSVCFLSAWKKPLRHLFFIPVTLLGLAVILILISGSHP